MKKLFIFVLAAIGMVAAACSSESPVTEVSELEADGKMAVRLLIKTGVAIETRASLTANGKALTDLYIFDYNKTTGALLQVLHQTSDAPDFAEPLLTLDYGTHVLKLIASRSESPFLRDNSGSVCGLKTNAITDAQTLSATPSSFHTVKTSDTFGAVKELEVKAGGSSAVSVTLDRYVAKLELLPTDVFPDDCSTIDVELPEHSGIDLNTMDVTAAVNNHRVSDVSPLAGRTDVPVSYFFLVPKAGTSIDVTLTMNRTAGAPYSKIIVEDVPLDRNRVTTIRGQFYNRAQGVSISIADTWNTEKNTIDI